MWFFFFVKLQCFTPAVIVKNFHKWYISFQQIMFIDHDYMNYCYYVCKDLLEANLFAIVSIKQKENIHIYIYTYVCMYI